VISNLNKSLKRTTAASILVALTMTLMPFADALAAGNSLAWETFYDLGNRLLKSGALADAEKQISLAMKEAQLFGPQDIHVLKTLKLMSQLYKAQNRTAEEESINKVIAEMESKAGTATPAAAADATAHTAAPPSKERPAWLVTADPAEGATKPAGPPEAKPTGEATSAAPAGEPPAATYGSYESTALPAQAPQAATPQPTETPAPTDTGTSAYNQASSAPTREATELKQMSGHINWVKSIVVSRDGTRAVSGGADNSVRLWDMAQGKQIRQYSGHTNQVNTVVFTPDEKYIVSGSDDCTVRVFEVESGNQVACFRGHTNLVTSIAVSEDGKRAISTGYDRTLKVLSLPDAKEVMTLLEHKQPVRCVSFLSNNRAVSGSDDGVLKFWDLGAQKEIRSVDAHGDSILSMAVSSDGLRVLTGSRDLSAKVWDAEKGERAQMLDGHKDWVVKVAFVEGTDKAITGSLDCTIRTWELSSGKELVEIGGLKFGIWSEAFTPDRKQALTGSNDKTIRVWSLPD